MRYDGLDVADRMGGGQMEREDFLPSTAATIDLQHLQLAFQMLGSFASIDAPIFQVWPGAHVVMKKAVPDTTEND